jgi:hypothetical protein
MIEPDVEGRKKARDAELCMIGARHGRERYARKERVGMKREGDV